MEITSDKAYITDIVKNARTGDSDAFAALFAATVSYQYRYARSYLQEEYLTQDALTETYTRALTELSSMDKPEQFVSWLTHINFEICHRMCHEKCLRTHPGIDELALEDLVNEQIRIGRENFLDAVPRRRIFPRRKKSPAADSDYPPKTDISRETASLLLENIFDSTRVQKNSIPLDSLFSMMQPKKTAFRFPRFVIVLAMAVILLMPLLYIAPEITVTEQNIPVSAGSSTLRPSYNLTVTTPWYPIRKVTASLNGKAVTVYQKGQRIYTVLPDANGKMTITAELLNHQKTSKVISITSLDLTAPVIDSYDVRGGKVYLKISDAGSGIDYSSIYAVKRNKETIRPESSYKTLGEVVFEAPERSLTVYISDKNGNQLKITIDTKDNSDGSSD